MQNKKLETPLLTRKLRFGVAIAGLAAIVCWRFSSVLANLGTHFADFEALHGTRLLFELFDTRLNAWILSWVTHASLSQPFALYDTNAFYPAHNALTGSEHLFGLAVQVLPLRIFTQNAVALHQLALVGSAALLGLTTLLATRWVTGSLFSGFLAGAFAVSMPWRVTELSHLQLASVHFFPLIWMLMLRILLGEAKRRDLMLLSFALALQLLSSFYLAYFLSLSCLVMLGVSAALRTPRWQDLRRLALAAAPGYLLLGLSAIPYLQRQGETSFAAHLAPHFSLSLDFILGYLAPRWPYGWNFINAPASYWTPWAVLILATLAIFSGLRVRSSEIQTDRIKLRVATLSLLAIVGTSVVMMLGASILVAGVEITLPSTWLRDWVPGFSMLRGPTRWGILVGIALPILAGIGAWEIERRSAERIVQTCDVNHRARLRPHLTRLLGRGVIVLACASTVSWVPIPTRPAWDDATSIEARYHALLELPAGPIIELPWANAAGHADHGTRALLGSTQHWRPLLNGYTGHPPRPYSLLHRIAQRLPDPVAIRQLSRLTGLRWILVDWKRTPTDQHNRWLEAVRQGWIEPVHQDNATRIFEVRAWASGADLVPALLDDHERTKTFGELPRTPLELSSMAGDLHADFAKRHLAGFWLEVQLQLDNRSPRDWPSFDLDEEGLVVLRYSFKNKNGTSTTQLVPLDRDIPAYKSVSLPILLHAPMHPGAYEICLDIVQRWRGSIRRLPIRSVVRDVALSTLSERDEFYDIIASAAVSPTQPPACEPND